MAKTEFAVYTAGQGAESNSKRPSHVASGGFRCGNPSHVKGVTMSTATRKPFGVFWDNSNIVFSRNELIPKYDPNVPVADLRVHFLNMFDYVRYQRVVDTFVMVGSLPPDNDPLWKRVSELKNHVKGKFELIKLNRDAHNKEQGIDDTLRAELFRFCTANIANPGTVALLTGDGAGYGKGKGFQDAVEIISTKLKWQVELCAWDCSCHAEMKALASAQPMCKYRNLEFAYWEVTFVKNGRGVKGLPKTLQSIKPNARQPA